MNVYKGGNIPKTQEKIIEEFEETHGIFYLYDRAVYVNYLTPLLIGCPDHGYFEQTFSSHIQFGCLECSKIKQQKKKQIEKIQEFENKYGKDRYNYDKVIYKNCKTKILIECLREGGHGYFEQLPNAHLTIEGCPQCNGHSFSLLSN